MSTLADKPSSSSSALDPLFKDLNERKQIFRRNVVSLAAELKDVRSKLALKEEVFGKEIITRQVVEEKARNMEEEICCLQKSLEERSGELQASASKAEQYLKEMDDLRSQLLSTQATADASAASAQSAQLQCLVLSTELDEKNNLLKEHESSVNRLEEQLDLLQKELQGREASQKQLKDEVLKLEREIMEAVVNAGVREDCELRKLLDEVSFKNFKKMNKHLTEKDEEIIKLRDQIKIMSAHWKLKTKDLQSQLEKHQRAEQELKKRVMKLEFCIQEARSQNRKLQRVGEKKDKLLNELRDQLAMKQQEEGLGIDKQKFWESSGLKVIVSMTMFVLVVFGKR